MDYQCRLFGLRGSYELKTNDASSAHATITTSAVSHKNDNEETPVRILEFHSNDGGYVIRFDNINERV